MQQPDRTADLQLAQMASRSHGVVTRVDLLAAGFSPEEIRQRMRRGTLIRIHRGIYRVGHTAPSREATYLAAVRACGPGALLAGRAAAHLWRLIKGRPPQPEVLSPKDRRVAGVLVHRARNETRHNSLGPRSDSLPLGAGVRLPDATLHLRIPITTVPRTLVDIASWLPVPALTRACHEADVLHRLEPEQVEAVLARRPNARGIRTLRRILHGDEPIALSRLESRFFDCLLEAGLPPPDTNRPAGGRRVDCRWPEHRLTVELDSYRYHRSRQSWEQDRQRERAARARGDEFRRYTWVDVAEQPGPMLRDLAVLLARSTARSKGS